jgi:membrane protease subunit (stomatin/prohibitin family)
MAGGIGYMMGRQSGQQYQQPQYQQPQYQPPQQYQQPYYQPPQPQQTPQYQAPQQYQQPAAGASNDTLAQLKLLGHLRDNGLLTDDEFEAEKQKILHGQ